MPDPSTWDLGQYAAAVVTIATIVRFLVAGLKAVIPCGFHLWTRSAALVISALTVWAWMRQGSDLIGAAPVTLGPVEFAVLTVAGSGVAGKLDEWLTAAKPLMTIQVTDRGVEVAGSPGVVGEGGSVPVGVVAPPDKGLTLCRHFQRLPHRWMQYDRRRVWRLHSCPGGTA